MHKTHIVKRKGHREPYDERKIYATVYRACLNAHISKEESERIAAAVTDVLNAWVNPKSEVTSREIFRQAADALEKQNPDAAFMYESHRDIS